MGDVVEFKKPGSSRIDSATPERNIRWAVVCDDCFPGRTFRLSIAATPEQGEATAAAHRAFWAGHNHDPRVILRPELLPGTEAT